MNYHNIPFYIASNSVIRSNEIGKLLSRQNNTVFTVIDIPEIYNYLKKCNNFTTFLMQLTNDRETHDNIIKSINQKNPSFPVILISDEEITFKVYRHYITAGASDILVTKGKTKNELLTEIVNILNLKWRSYLFTKKENEKIYKASVVTINHEINQPLTVILNAIGLLKAELKNEAEKDIKINSHLNFISKGINRIQDILDSLKNLKKLALKEYTPGVWMVNLRNEPVQQIPLKQKKINNKNIIVVVEKNLEEKVLIESELRKMGLEIVTIPNLKDVEKIIDKLIHKIQAVLFSANIPAQELESTLYNFNNRNETIPLILIRNAETSTDSMKIMDSTAFQVINKPVSSRSLRDAIANSVIVAS